MTARSIDLPPCDWAWATWRPLPKWSAAPAAPFDLASLVKRLGKVKTSGDKWNFAPALIAENLSREEAHFWLLAMTGITKAVKPKARAAQLVQEKKLGSITEAAVKSLLVAQKGHSSAVPAEIVLPLVNLLGAQKTALLMLDPAVADSILDYRLTDGFRRFALLRLSAVERADLQKILAARVVSKAKVPANYFANVHAATFMGALLGMHQPMRLLVEQIPDDVETHGTISRWNPPHRLIFGLGDASLVEKHMRRCGLHLWEPEHARAWIAHTGHTALDLMVQSALEGPWSHNKAEAEAFVAALGTVHAPETVGPMHEMAEKSKAPAAAWDWLAKNKAKQ